MKSKKMDFRAYYESLKKQPAELRDQICEQLGISQETFYVKLRNNSFDYPQRVVIAQIIDQPVEELFPQSLAS